MLSSTCDVTPSGVGAVTPCSVLHSVDTPITLTNICRSLLELFLLRLARKVGGGYSPHAPPSPWCLPH